MKRITKHKDKLFIFVLLVTLGNIVYWTFMRILDLTNKNLHSTFGMVLWNILIILSGLLAIWAILYLIRNYHRNLKKEEAKENEEHNS